MSEERGESVQKTLPIRGELHLEPRPGDRAVDPRMLQEFSLFSRMKKKFSVDKLPGSILLRKYRQGEVVFQQGQEGGTAFYIPTDIELSRVAALDNGEPTENAAVKIEKNVASPDHRRQILSAMLMSSASKTRPRGVFERLFSPMTKQKASSVAAIPSDGPTDINYETREAPLMEGDLFGEMSCISFSPRSATVIARVDCQLVEFNRNVFDRVRDDPNHLAAVEEEYRRRTLETHLRQFELFRGLSESQIGILKSNVTLEIVPPGKVICEEHEPWNDAQPLDVFIVRNGIVQVSMHTSLSLRNEEILNWSKLCDKLHNSMPGSDADPKPAAVTTAARPALPQRPPAAVGAAASSAPKATSMPAHVDAGLRVSDKASRPAEASATAPAVTKPPESGAPPKKLSPIEEMRAKKAAAAALEAGPVPTSSEPPAAAPVAAQSIESASPAKKLSPIEEMRARKAAAAALEAGQMPVATEQTAAAPIAEQTPEPAPPAKKLSPIEEMRARKAAAVALEAGQVPVSTEQTAATPIAEQPLEPAPPTKKLSPIEEMRARKAAAAALEAGQVPVSTEQTAAAPIAEQTTEPALPAKKLSPIEEMRARKAAAAALEAGQVPVSTEQTAAAPIAEQTPEPALPAKKLSPIEEMRARKAAAAALEAGQVPAGSEPATVAPPIAAPTPEAASPAKKLSPIEEMRARKAAAAALESGSSPVPAEKSADAVISEKPPEAGTAPKKLSPLEQMRAKKAALESGVASKPVTDASPLPAGKASAAPITTAASGTGIQSAASATPAAKAASPAIAAKKPSLLRKAPASPSGDPAFLVKSWMNNEVQEAIRQIAQGELQDSALLAAQQLVLDALNELMREPEFLSDACLIAKIYPAPELVRKIAAFPKGLMGIKKDWSELELRSTGRTVLSEIFADAIRKPKQTAGPPRVLAYLSRGDCFGEIAVVRREPRMATCIAYNHPSSEVPRDFGNVELVRIKGSAFRQLMDESPKLRKEVEDLAEKRRGEADTAETDHTETDLIASTEFQQMGLFQGSKLLVIDLDSCTRCGDCVDACVKTHDDGYSRLFLDGPRYDRFLVPSACRNCLNPVCMIGCPVGAIGRGANGQIEITDWCIGCSKCADQCPYDSIQMHDVGLIPEQSMGWLYSDSKSLPRDWNKSLRLSGGWMQGKSPFLWQGELLQQVSTSQQQLVDQDPLHLYFRHEFRLSKKSRAGRYRLSINDAKREGTVKKIRVKTSKLVSVWLNGEELKLSGNSIDLPAEKFVSNVNLIAIEVSLDQPAEYGQIVLSACLDAIPEASELVFEMLGKDVRPEMDLVTLRAAVCDLCSHTPSQQPACVSSCPHDAAIRINPLVNFPR